MDMLRYGNVGGGQPYHAALVPVPDSKEPGAGAHYHADFHELVYVKTGRGWHHIGAERRRLEPGMLVLVRPHDVHSFSSLPGERIHFVNVAFASDRWRAFLDYAGIVGGAAWDRAPLPIVAAKSDAVDAAVGRALAAYQSEPSSLDLVSLWAAVIPLLTAVDAPADRRPWWLTQACAAMESEDNLRRGLPRMVELAAVNPAHLARCMREHYGCTPVQFVGQTRLAHAAAALATGAEPIGNIAFRFGFGSQSYFGRCFAQRYGVTPRHFRDRSSRAVVPQ